MSDHRDQPKVTPAAATAIAHQIGQALKATHDRLLKAAVLGGFGWTIPLAMDFRVLHGILSLNDPDLIDKAFVEHYVGDEKQTYLRLRENLLANGLLAEKRKLLVQCLGAFERGEFLIVVPSLLTILEGIMAKQAKTFLSGKDRAEFFNGKIDS